MTAVSLISFGPGLMAAAVVGRDQEYSHGDHRIQVQVEGYRFQAAGYKLLILFLPVDRTSLVLSCSASRITNDIKQVSGRDPRGFAQYLREAAATGVWISGADEVTK